MRLGSRIMQFLKDSRQRTNRARLTEDDVSSLKTLPMTMLRELHFEVHASALKGYPPFAILSSDEHQVPAVADICHRAVREVSFQKGEEAFEYGMHATSMHIVVAGAFNYSYGPIRSITASTTASR